MPAFLGSSPQKKPYNIIGESTVHLLESNDRSHVSQPPASFPPAPSPSRQRYGEAPNMMLARSQDSLFSPSRDEQEDLADYSPTHPFRMPRVSLTPSMSASNLGHNAQSDDGHTGAQIWEQMQAGQQKLQSSKDKYDFVPADFRNLGPEPDDEMHDPGPSIKERGPDRLVQDSKKTRAGTSMSCLGVMNLVAIAFIACALVGVFAGLPITEHFLQSRATNAGAYGLYGTNSSGQVPQLQAGMIDSDTPQSAYKKSGYWGDDYVLIFSDEFNHDGRTFWPGDDPYWEAQSLHYYGTNDLERYIPDQATTSGGNLVITMNRTNPATNGGLNYVSAMLNTWNKFCFTGGIFEVHASLPGDGIVPGFWPAAWTMGNLGRPGFGATNDGVWPYSYDSCDVGTLPNQTDYGNPSLPALAATSGKRGSGGSLSYLPGQKLSSCTCPNSDHPGPKLSNGSYKGRSAPEIDLIEAQTNRGQGTVSSQSYQLAPFNAYYAMLNSTNGRGYPGTEFNTLANEWTGGVYQQAASGISQIPADQFEATNGFGTYAFEYYPSDTGQGRIAWLQNNICTWWLTDADLASDSRVNIGARLVSNEPMFPILNFAISEGFGQLEEANLPFPAQYRIDYVRVYQRTGHIDYGCDGMKGDYPTSDYIQNHLSAYTDNNLTLWSDLGWEWPKNSMQGGC